MTALPSSAALTNFAASSGTMKTVHTDLRAFLAGLLGEDGTPPTALAALGAVGAGYTAKTGAYTVTTADRGLLVQATSGTWTLALPAAATAGAGFVFGFTNVGTGTITIDPNGAELIDGASTIAAGPLRSGLIFSTGAAWRTVGQIGSVTSTSTDTTAGRLLKVGDFGLGAAAIADFDADATGLVTRVGRMTPPNTPNGADNYLGWHVSRAADLQSAQIGIRSVNAPGTPQLEFRQRGSDGVWGEWARVFHGLNAIGTVSQASGVPTGGLIERAGNANGQYVRFADGTQFCYRQATVEATDTAVAWAASFATADYRATPPVPLGTTPYFTGYGLKNVGDYTPRVWDTAGARVTVGSVEMIAIGRWY